MKKIVEKVMLFVKKIGDVVVRLLIEWFVVVVSECYFNFDIYDNKFLESVWSVGVEMFW